MPRLVLFDIDGTLLRSGGVGRRSLERAFRDRYMAEGVFEEIRFHGRTDREIVGDGLALLGRSLTELDSAIEHYLHFLALELPTATIMALPGVKDLIVRLRALPETTLGLVTGNVRRGAELKLSRDELFHYFDVGAFGDDSIDRGELVKLARKRAMALGRGPFLDTQVFHVGDTEKDIQAARDGSAVAVAVATGGMSREELAAHAPDHLFDTLENTEHLLEEVFA